MINRLYLRELILFDEVELELEKGLVVLSGPSGAGKSLLMNSILSLFGYSMAEASLCEVTIDKPHNLNSEAYELEDEITLKALKKWNVRYYIDGQNISKKVIKRLFSPFVQYLSVRDKSSFESGELIALIDNALLSKEKSFKKLQQEYTERYLNYKRKVDELNKIKQDELRLAELIEFANFEIDKIMSINPKIGEDESLLKVKYQLSRIDKVNEALEQANTIFNVEESVCEVYRLLDKDASGFIEMMNQLRADFEDIELLSDELAEVNIEEVLDRLEKISSLKNRYGSIKGALTYAETKRKELAGYQNIEQDKSKLEHFLTSEFSELTTMAGRISQARKREALILEKELAEYLWELKLPPLKFIFESTELTKLGLDRLDVNLNGSKATTLSGGEFNRVRLALMVVAISGVKEGGVLILDEIDANVSGDESIAIANMIAKLSSVYQVFAISHQAHLASKANQHILVSKQDSRSSAVILDREGRVDEVARIIGGEKPNREAIEFSKKLLEVK
ncbi:DNA repair protein RecN [hydrothermal vent metagenome]|uniref:DNA repair protein RecN n=1 Tax=hydrothermal vent metagenome TaxID=652676 RepID=A0A1W1CGQ9_9ZZZZ